MELLQNNSHLSYSIMDYSNNSLSQPSPSPISAKFNPNKNQTQACLRLPPLTNEDEEIECTPRLCTIGNSLLQNQQAMSEFNTFRPVFTDRSTTNTNLIDEQGTINEINREFKVKTMRCLNMSPLKY